MKKLNHLSEVFGLYDAFIIDLWGVMHNGINLNFEAIEVVENLHKYNKRITFLSNAPRPNESVIKFLRKLKMDKKFCKYVLTSGEAAIKSLKEKKFGVKKIIQSWWKNIHVSLGHPWSDVYSEGLVDANRAENWALEVYGSRANYDFY